MKTVQINFTKTIFKINNEIIFILSSKKQRFLKMDALGLRTPLVKIHSTNYSSNTMIFY